MSLVFGRVEGGETRAELALSTFSGFVWGGGGILGDMATFLSLIKRRRQDVRFFPASLPGAARL
jgi:hypothetical protein